METGTYRWSSRMCIVRPALGCIVEGEGERESFQSLIFRLCQTIVKPIQIAQAHSNGDITANLEDKLTDLADTHAPITIIVCLDLVDALHKNNRFTCCEDLLRDLETRASCWMHSKRIIDTKLPQQISIVAIIPAFDGWLFADIETLKKIMLC